MNRRTDWMFSSSLYLALLLALSFFAGISWQIALLLSVAGLVFHNYLLEMFSSDDIHEEHASSVRSALVDHLFASAPMLLLYGLIAVVAH